MTSYAIDKLNFTAQRDEFTVKVWANRYFVYAKVDAPNAPEAKIYMDYGTPIPSKEGFEALIQEAIDSYKKLAETVSLLKELETGAPLEPVVEPMEPVNWGWRFWNR